jgi:hypothetical protein
MNQALKYAQEIQNQMRVIGGQAVLWSWAFNKPCALPEGEISEGKYRKACLQFNVSGMKFKGTVRVNLMADDTYTLQFGKMAKGEFIATKTIEDQYVDTFVSTLDEIIETNVN